MPYTDRIAVETGYSAGLASAVGSIHESWFWLSFCDGATLSERISSRVTNSGGENGQVVRPLPRLRAPC
ncbi:hypothetical protein GCM10010376_77440 [Streptomyces violaceusniger]